MPSVSSAIPKKKLGEMVVKVLKSLEEDYSTDINTPDSSTNMTSISSTSNQETPAQQSADASKQRVDLIKQKKELEAKAKQNKQQRDNYSTTVKNYDTFQKKTDRDAIDTINTQLSQPVQTSSTTTTTTT
jgi:molecular chaperone GrpE (heat shock protein)